MNQQFDFALVTPDHNEKNIVALKTFLEGYDLKVCLLAYTKESLENIIHEGISNVVVFNENESRFAMQFITEASVRKIFNTTSFYYLSENFHSMDEQVKLMTLGFMGFLRFPFNALEVQNTIDLCEIHARNAA